MLQQIKTGFEISISYYDRLKKKRKMLFQIFRLAHPHNEPPLTHDWRDNLRILEKWTELR